MKISVLIAAGALATLTASASAALVEGVSESTNPARVAEVERHADELRAQAQTMSGQPRQHMRHQHHGKRHPTHMRSGNNVPHAGSAADSQ